MAIKSMRVTGTCGVDYIQVVDGTGRPSFNLGDTSQKLNIVGENDLV